MTERVTREELHRQSFRIWQGSTWMLDELKDELKEAGAEANHNHILFHALRWVTDKVRIDQFLKDQYGLVDGEINNSEETRS